VSGRLTVAIGVLLSAGVLAALAVLAASSDQPTQSTVSPITRWDPLAQPRDEADTTFRPDLGSASAIASEGGIFTALGEQPQAHVARAFDLGSGRFGPAVRARRGEATHLRYPIDGLLDGREFTVEWWSRSERAWSKAPDGSVPFSLISPSGNRIEFTLLNGRCQVIAGTSLTVPGQEVQKSWGQSCDALRLDADRWHHLALTFKNDLLRIYVGGRLAGSIADLPLAPSWSDDTFHGVQVGGDPRGSSGFWISDIRFSRTARVPHRPTRLRSLEGRVVIDADRTIGATPGALVGALHPTIPHASSDREQVAGALTTIRTASMLTATPMKRGSPDKRHPTLGRSGRFSYDWQVVDRDFAWLRRNRVRAWIGLDSTPQLLGGQQPPFSGSRLRDHLSFNIGYNSHPPQQLREWADVVGDFVHHVRVDKRYEVERWAVWNEPDGPGFWTGTMGDYLDLYSVTARAVHEIDQDTPIGGPELSNLEQGSQPWIESLFRRAARDQLPLDYISVHDYSGDLDNLSEMRQVVDAHAERNGFKTPFPIVIGEFNWSNRTMHEQGRPGPFHTDLWHIRAFGSAYTSSYLARLLATPGIESLIYSHTSYCCTVGDERLETVDRNPRRGGYAALQLLGPNFEQWAPYNALRGWRAVLGDDRLRRIDDLPPGVHAYAGRDRARGRIGIALSSWGWAQRRPRAVTVDLRALPAGRWRMRRYVVDEHHSSRWDIAEDRSDGARADELQLVEQRIAEAGELMRMRMVLSRWSSTFVVLDPVRE